MITPKSYHAPAGHYHQVRGHAVETLTGTHTPLLALIPEWVMDDRQAMLELRDELVSYLTATAPSFTDGLMGPRKE